MTSKYLITGFSGFVSRHFLEYLENNKIESEVLGVDISAPDFDFDKFKFVKCTFKSIDLLNQSQVNSVFREYKPNYILHLASYSSVAFSWKNPHISFTNNTNIFLNILEEVRLLNLDCRILSVGSSEEYGNVKADTLPLDEDHSLNPISPYAVARVSQEMLSKIYADGFGLKIIMTRSFNHIGTGQKDTFVIPSFAKQLTGIKQKNLPPELHAGDISVIRDFVDVRDVVNAYYKLFEHGKIGSVYNICSGIGISLQDIILKMSDILGIRVKTYVDEKMIRPNDNRIIIGSNKKIKADTGWKNEITIDQSLKEILDFYQ
jgi:GDP-4-dehydro-6-deoxy-D-mannose reductase